jgi:hypothetical protein
MQDHRGAYKIMQGYTHVILNCIVGDGTLYMFDTLLLLDSQLSFNYCSYAILIE